MTLEINLHFCSHHYVAKSIKNLICDVMFQLDTKEKDRIVSSFKINNLGGSLCW